MASNTDQTTPNPRPEINLDFIEPWIQRDLGDAPNPWEIRGRQVSALLRYSTYMLPGAFYQHADSISLGITLEIILEFHHLEYLRRFPNHAAGLPSLADLQFYHQSLQAYAHVFRAEQGENADSWNIALNLNRSTNDAIRARAFTQLLRLEHRLNGGSGEVAALERRWMMTPTEAGLQNAEAIERGMNPPTVNHEDDNNSFSRSQERDWGDACEPLDDETCPICYADFDHENHCAWRAHVCGHIFGFECMESWIDQLRIRTTCPLCRRLLLVVSA